jgi:hypothetical protein
MADLFKTPIFIVGVPRSGTSMVAGCLAACGVWSGSTVGATTDNPKGFYEHAGIREQIIKPLLANMGCDPLGVRKLPTDEILATQKAGRLATKIKKMIDKDGYTGKTKWLYKEPKLTLIWPLFAEAFPNAKWVIVKRDKDAFIDSCLRTSFMRQHTEDPKFWSWLYDNYTQHLHNLKKAKQPVYAIDSKKIASGDFSTFEKLCKVLGVRFNKSAVEEFVSPELYDRKP